MADNVTTQSSTLATVPSGTKVATREVTYSGDASSHIAPTGLVTFSGSDDAKSATDVPAGGGVEATALRVTIASDSTGLVSVDDNGGSLTVDGTVAVSGTVTVAAHDVGSITTAVTPGTAAANLGKAEDAAHASGDVGVMALAVRQASPANLSGAAGDYEPLQVNGGRLWASATIDAAIPAGTNNIGDVDVLSVPAPLSTTGGGTEATALRVTIANDSTGVVSVDDNGGSLTVDGTVTANLAAGTNNIGDVDVLSVPAPLNVTGGGTEATALRVTLASDSTGVVSVDDNGASITVDGTVTASNTTGNVAHDSADSGNPIKIGAKAKSTLEAVTTVAADDRTDLYADLNGALIVRPMAPHGDMLVERVSDSSGTSTAFTTFGAPGAGVRNYITMITVHNSSTTTGGFVDIRDGAAGAVLFTIPAPAGGGAVIPFGDLPLRQPTANTALAYDVSAAISTIYISMVGYQSNV